MLRNLFIETNSGFYCCECVWISIVCTSFPHDIVYTRVGEKKTEYVFAIYFPVFPNKKQFNRYPWHCGWILWSLIDVLTKFIYLLWCFNIAKRFSRATGPHSPTSSHTYTHPKRRIFVHLIYRVREIEGIFRIFPIVLTARVSLPFM